MTQAGEVTPRPRDDEAGPQSIASEYTARTSADEEQRPAAASSAVQTEELTGATEPVPRLTAAVAVVAATARRAAPILLRVAPPTAILGVAAFLRLWRLASVGFNSDEAVYAGTAGSIAGDPTLRSMFPVFRAHPLLFQSILSLTGTGRPSELAARSVPAVIGVATVLVTYLLGNRLYGRRAGLVAAALLAVMPYHVLISRQVLLDGLMTFCATVVLYCIARYADSLRSPWLLAAGAMMGLAVLSKETSVVLLGGIYAFFALAPVVRIKIRHVVGALAAMLLTIVPFPFVLSLSGRVSTGQNYLLWQMFRPSNHSGLFYFTTVPFALGLAVLVAAFGGWIWLWRENTWRERLLLCWIAVPVAFFTLWPVKGYQYLLPIAPPLAILAGRTLSRLGGVAALRHRRWLSGVTVAALSLVAVVSLAVPAWARIDPAPTGTFLAGTGGLPGGREAGNWVRANVPAGAQLLTIGPSLANVLEFYGSHRVFAVSVSANPRDRNPSYVPVANPDRALRDGDFQYIVWDSYTADRSSFFATQARRLIDKYHGVAVYTGTVSVLDASGHRDPQPVVVIYEVRPQ